MIKISCETNQALTLEEIETFQGELKSINRENLEKLKSSIIRYGFSFPIFVWGKKILDGHQRFTAIKELLQAGEELQDNKLPIVEIKAYDEKEAAEKLLLINSRYAEINQSGFNSFIENFDLDLERFGKMIELPEIDLGFMQSDGDDGEDDEMIKTGFEYKIVIECKDEKEQVNFIKSIEELGIECSPLIL